MMKHLFFTGPNCAGCQMLKGAIKANAKEHYFEFINVEENPRKAMEFSIRSIPTIVANDYRLFTSTKDALRFIREI